MKKLDPNERILRKREDRRKYASKLRDVFKRGNVRERCPGCGGMTFMPCLKCRDDGQKRSERL